MRILLTVIVTASLTFSCASSACAADAAAQVSDNHPWVADKRLIDESIADVQAGGILALKPHVPDLEQALARAPKAYALAAQGDGNTKYALTDGPADTLLILLTAAADKSHPAARTEAVPNPYPAIAFYLGSYYDEIGQPAEAVRVLEAGLALPDMITDAERPSLLVERGAAYSALKRWPESLASYEEALKIPDLPDTERAYMYRGRGFALIELGRLDEAEAAYNESLKLAPGNERAESELRYIARIRAGGAPTATSLTTVQPPHTTMDPANAPQHR